ncbi:oligosaccharide flippase family protein [Methanogenium sp. MK-MG]|uniref:oligosaccharide flippase family protein n=1 Tax=Methanogenium sp. MK-MG TaxID=2599926 RepID=UPI0013EAEC9F|nr:oligosaccharide flippase family protein [Methanogenium sp. MK-MG]KAF1079002.1 hypothetical protein MKMG_00010 [Methanogenium sp. MK-MG]
MQSDSETNKKFASQLPRNLAANIGYFLVNIVIGLLLVPYFIDTLGVAAYGLIPLATSVTGYVAIFIHSLNTSVSRFLTVDLRREDYEAANRTFNTSLFGLTAVIALMVPFAVVVAYFIPLIFNVPAGQESGAQLLFLGVCAAFFIRAWSGNFTVQLFAYNRLDLQNIVNISNIIVQVGLIVLFFTLFGPSLVLVGLAYLGGSVVSSCISIIFAKRVCPNLQVSLHSFDQRRVKSLCGMGWWVVINQIGSLLFLQVDLIVVNMIFGADAGGEYAIALQWVVLLRAVAGTLSGVLTPMVLTYYVQNRTETLIRVTKSAVKFMGLAMALPIGLVCGFSPQLITIWVGSEFAFLAPLMMLLTCHLVINLAVLPLFAINVAYNRVRIPGIVTFFMGFANFALAIGLSILTGWGYYGVAAAGVIVLTLKNTIFTPWYATRVLGVSAYTFIRSMVPGIVAFILVFLAASILGNFLFLSTIVPLVIAGGAVVLFYGIAILKFGLNTFERQLFSSYLPPGIRRILA